MMNVILQSQGIRTLKCVVVVDCHENKNRVVIKIRIIK